MNTLDIFRFHRIAALAAISISAGCVGPEAAGDVEVSEATLEEDCLQILDNGQRRICHLRTGTTVYDNGGQGIWQVALVNRSTETLQLRRVEVRRAPGQGVWQEVGVLRCREFNAQGEPDGAGCNQDPPGQIAHGLGDIHNMNAQPGSDQFLPPLGPYSRGNGVTIEPGHYVLIQSTGIVGGSVTVEVAPVTRYAQVWRLPRRDVNHPPSGNSDPNHPASLNPCSGGVDSLMSWGRGKNNPDGQNHYWVNDTGVDLHVSAVSVAVVNGGPTNTPLTHNACLTQYDPAGGIVAQACEISGDGVYPFQWGFAPGNVIALQAWNQCPAGNLWNMVATLHID